MSQSGREEPGYWSAQRLSIRITAPDGSETTQELGQPFALIGSHQKCDVVIADDSVAPQSLFVCATDSGLALVVLSRRAKKAGRALRIEPQQLIPVRDWSVQMHVTSNTEVTRTQPIADASSDLPEAVHCLTWKSSLGRQYLQLRHEHPLLIGRKTPANLILDDDRMSAVHCCVFRSGNRLWVVDLGSTNGTWSQGDQQRVHAVSLDKSICLGSQRLHYTTLVPAQHHRTIAAQVTALEQESAATNRFHLETMSDATMQQAGLLTSLRLAHEQTDQLRLDSEREMHRQTSWTAIQQTRLTELEQQHATAVADKSALLEQISTSHTVQAELHQQMECLHHQVEQLEDQRRQLDAQLANREMDLALREQELDRLATEAERQRQETIQLKEELNVERRVLGTLELELEDIEELTSSKAEDEEHCVASPDFHAILEEALESLPRLED